MAKEKSTKQKIIITFWVVSIIFILLLINIFAGDESETSDAPILKKTLYKYDVEDINYTVYKEKQFKAHYVEKVNIENAMDTQEYDILLSLYKDGKCLIKKDSWGNYDHATSTNCSYTQNENSIDIKYDLNHDYKIIRDVGGTDERATAEEKDLTISGELTQNGKFLDTDDKRFINLQYEEFKKALYSELYMDDKENIYTKEKSEDDYDQYNYKLKYDVLKNETTNSGIDITKYKIINKTPNYDGCHNKIISKESDLLDNVCVSFTVDEEYGKVQVNLNDNTSAMYQNRDIDNLEKFEINNKSYKISTDGPSIYLYLENNGDNCFDVKFTDKNGAVNKTQYCYNFRPNNPLISVGLNNDCNLSIGDYSMPIHKYSWRPMYEDKDYYNHFTNLQLYIDGNTWEKTEEGFPLNKYLTTMGKHEIKVVNKYGLSSTYIIDLNDELRNKTNCGHNAGYVFNGKEAW